MQFPGPSETFISSRIRTLLDSGHEPRVFALRGALAGHDNLARERNVETIRTSHNGFRSSLNGIAEGFKRPELLFRSIAWILRTSRRNIAQLTTALAILPRSFDILAQLEREVPDVLHTEWGHYPSVIAFLVQKRLPDTVVSVSLIAYDLDAEFGGTIEVVRNASVVRTQAHVNVDQIARFTGISPARVAVIYDGVDLKPIRAIHTTIDKVPGRFVVAGRLIPEKGIDDAIRVFAATRSKVEGIHLRILGDGSDFDRLHLLARDLGVDRDIEFLGHVSHEQVLKEFSSAEIHLHMSHSERLPNVVKEAMACECVCITSRTAGIEELVEDGATGFVVGLGEIERSALIAEELLQDPKKMATIGAAAHRFVEANFDHDDNVHLLLDLWLSAAKMKGSLAKE